MGNYSFNENRGSRFMTIKEISAQFKKQRFDCKQEQPGGGIPVWTNGVEFYGICDNQTHCLTVSSTSAGKTRRVCLPSVISYALSGYNFCVNDPKGEIHHFLRPYLETLNYSVYVLDFRHPTSGNRYHLFSLAYHLHKKGQTSEAEKILRRIFTNLAHRVESEKDPYWHNVSVSTLTGLVQILFEEVSLEECNFNNLYTLLMDAFEKTSAGRRIHSYLKHKKNKSIRRNLHSVAVAPNDTLTSILSVLSELLNGICLSEDVIQMVSTRCDFSVDEMCDAKTKTAVFLITEDENEVNGSLVNCLIENFYTEILMCANANGGVLERPFRFILDEFANMGRLNTIGHMLSESRSRGILFNIYIQSMEQLKNLYGSALADTIKENCANLVFLSSPSISLVRELSERCGYMEIDGVGTREKLVTEEQLLFMQPGDALIFTNRNFPLFAYLPEWSCYTLFEPDVTEYSVTKKKTECATIPEFDFEKAITRLSDEATREFISKLEPPRVPEPPKPKKTEKKDSPRISSMDSNIFEDTFRKASSLIESGKLTPKDIHDLLNNTTEKEDNT